MELEREAQVVYDRLAREYPDTCKLVREMFAMERGRMGDERDRLFSMLLRRIDFVSTKALGPTTERPK